MTTATKTRKSSAERATTERDNWLWTNDSPFAGCVKVCTDLDNPAEHTHHVSLDACSCKAGQRGVMCCHRWALRLETQPAPKPATITTATNRPQGFESREAFETARAADFG